MAQQDYLTPSEVAGLLRCNVVTVYKALRSGQLQGKRIGRHWRVASSAVARWGTTATE